MKKIQTLDIVECALFAALVAVGAFIRLPGPFMSFTLQVEFAILAGLLLGARRGALSVLCYLLVGLLGVPVFTEGGGPMYVLKPTFGYLLGFCVGAWLTGYLARRGPAVPSMARLLGATLAGIGVIYLFGVLWFWLITRFYLGRTIGFRVLMLNCFLLTVPGDLIACTLCAILARRLIPLLNRLHGRRKRSA